jgi:hypothetical protein
MRFIRNEIMRYQVVHTKLEERGVNSPFHLFRNCLKNVSILRFFLIFVRMGCTFEFLSRELSAVLIIQEILIVLKNDFCDIERWKHIFHLFCKFHLKVAFLKIRESYYRIPRYFLYKMAKSHSSTVSIDITINC